MYTTAETLFYLRSQVFRAYINLKLLELKRGGDHFFFAGVAKHPRVFGEANQSNKKKLENLLSPTKRRRISAA